MNTKGNHMNNKARFRSEFLRIPCRPRALAHRGSHRPALEAK